VKGSIQCQSKDRPASVRSTGIDCAEKVSIRANTQPTKRIPTVGCPVRPRKGNQTLHVGDFTPARREPENCSEVQLTTGICRSVDSTVAAPDEAVRRRPRLRTGRTR